MPNFLLLDIIFLIFTSCIIPVEMMSDYDYHAEDYPDRHDPMTMRRRERGRDPYGHGNYEGAAMPGRKNEMLIGQKRYKLYETKKLGFHKANEFCKKKEGRLVGGKQMKVLPQLQPLFIKAKLIGKDIWVSMEKKVWSKHMREVAQRASWPESQIAKMCPLLSLSNKGLNPEKCEKPMPYVCEYDRSRPRTTKMPKKKKNKNQEDDEENWINNNRDEI